MASPWWTCFSSSSCTFRTRSFSNAVCNPKAWSLLLACRILHCLWNDEVSSEWLGCIDIAEWLGWNDGWLALFIYVCSKERKGKEGKERKKDFLENTQHITFYNIHLCVTSNNQVFFLLIGSSLLGSCVGPISSFVTPSLVSAHSIYALLGFLPAFLKSSTIDCVCSIHISL